MLALFIILLLSLVAILGTTIALYLRVRRQLKASETALREALHELEHERESTKV
jgi:pilus assembly protein TadC